MCMDDNLFLLKVSNMGSGVRVDTANKVWSVRLPQMLQDKGPCSISVIFGHVQLGNSTNFIGTCSRIWVESNIPIQGCSTEIPSGLGSAGFTELFGVDMTPVYSDSAKACYELYMPHHVSFRCAGGLPSTITFAPMAFDRTLAVGAEIVPIPLYSGTNTTVVPQVDFHLAIRFDKEKDIP